MTKIDNNMLPIFNKYSIDISAKVAECKGEIKSEVQIFENLSLGKVRVVFFDGEPHFCLSDIAKVLDIKNGRDLKSDIDREFNKKDRFNLYPLETKSGKQNFSFINKSEVDYVLMRIDTPKAKPFRIWINNEILPSLNNKETLPAVKNANEVYISTLEIAKLTGKEHKNVLADCENYLSKVVDGGLLKFQQSYTNSQNRQFKHYMLPKREALILVSGYSVELRAKIIDRLEYLENEIKRQNAPALPQNYLEALEALTAEVRQRMALENKIKADLPKVEFADSVANAENSLSVAEFAKVVNSQMPMGQNRLFEWLRENGYLQKNNMPYQKYLDCGYFKMIEQSYNVKNAKFVTLKTLITGKGQMHLIKKLKEVAND